MLRFLILAFAVMWVVAVVGRFTRRLGRGPLVAIRGAGPPPEPEPRADRSIGALRVVMGAVLVIAFAGTLFALTDLSDVVVVLIAAPLAGLVSSLLTEWLVTEDDA